MVKKMKIKCNDGVTREFTTCKKLGYNYYSEAYCNECGRTFGVGHTNLIKGMFRSHICNYITCKLKNGDEPFQFLTVTWNVTEALKYAQANLKPSNMDKETVANYYNNFIKPLIHVSESHLRDVDITKPGLLVEISENPSTCIVIDGNHRLTRAYREGKEFSCYKISFAEQFRFITTIDGIQSVQRYNEGIERG